MPFRILFVEDDAEIAEFVAQGLREEGLLVTIAADGSAGRDEMESSQWDLIVLDWWLPKCEGITLLKRFREAGHSIPVLFLTARDAVSQRVEALNAGADDYLCKPFAFEELLARVHALLRRLPSSNDAVLKYSDIVLTLAMNRVERAGQPLQLTAREQTLLHFFLRHPGEVLSRTRLYEHVWQERFDGLSNTLEVHIMELRRKLEAYGPRVIQTVRGRGYMLVGPEEKTES
ncbi:MAG: response regulator transcription factor [Planctomycetaceae bacterium]